MTDTQTNTLGNLPSPPVDGKIKAIIFDLDGVIVDTAHYHYLAWKRLANELGGDLTLEQNERLKGVSRMRSLEIVLEIAGLSFPEEEMEKLAHKKNSWFVDYIEQMRPEEIFPGVVHLLDALKAKGMKLALASSSKNAGRVIELLGIQHYFNVFVDGTMITHTKPHPEIFLQAAEKMKVTPAECLVLEDAEAGVEAALHAGMKCIGVGSANQLTKANKVISKTGDLQIEMIFEI